MTDVMETQQKIIVTGFGKKVIVPAWAKLFPVRAVSLKDAAAMPTLPEVTVLQADEPRTTVPNFIGLLFGKALTSLKGLSCWLLRGPNVPPSKR